MKKIPLVSIPILAFLIIAFIFATVIPENGDLISANGDMALGQVIAMVFIIFLIIDIRNFIKNRSKK